MGVGGFSKFRVGSHKRVGVLGVLGFLGSLESSHLGLLPFLPLKAFLQGSIAERRRGGFRGRVDAIGRVETRLSRIVPRGELLWGWTHVRAGVVYKVCQLCGPGEMHMAPLNGRFHTLFEEQYYLFRQEEERHTQKEVLLARLREGASKGATDAVLTAEDAGI